MNTTPHPSPMTNPPEKDHDSDLLTYTNLQPLVIGDVIKSKMIQHK